MVTPTPSFIAVSPWQINYKKPAIVCIWSRFGLYLRIWVRLHFDDDSLNSGLSMEHRFLYGSNPDVFITQKNHTYSLQHNTGYMCAARFGLYGSHPQVMFTSGQLGCDSLNRNCPQVTIALPPPPSKMISWPTICKQNSKKNSLQRNSIPRQVNNTKSYKNYSTNPHYNTRGPKSNNLLIYTFLKSI